MNRTLATLAALGAATSVVLAADVMGQELTVMDSGRGSQSVYGRVVGVEQRTDLVALLTLDNGTQLSVSGKLSADEPRTGATVVGRYVDNGGRNVATSLRVIEAQAP
jgi:hypothetical protein